MTAVVEEVNTKVESDDDDEDSTGPGRTPDRDFTKHNERHQELADYVNEHSGLAAVTPFQIKAVQALTTDFRNTPEQAAKREERKAKREEEAKKYAGMSKEQIAAEKAATRQEKQIAKLQKRIEEAQAKAQRIREGKEGDGEALAAAVESDQANGEAKGKRTLSRSGKR